MVEGCRPIERGTPLRLAYGQPPPLTGEDGLERPLATIATTCKHVQVQTSDHPSGLRFRDLTTVDVFVAAAFGIAVSEGFAGLGFIADGPAIIAAMLFAGLYMSIRMSWPLRQKRWFWLWTFSMVIFDMIALFALRPGFSWVPALSLSPAIFLQVWVFLRGAEWLHNKSQR